MHDDSFPVRDTKISALVHCRVKRGADISTVIEIGGISMQVLSLLGSFVSFDWFSREGPRSRAIKAKTKRPRKACKYFCEVHVTSTIFIGCDQTTGVKSAFASQ